MLQKIIVGLASLIVIAALGGGGWWIAAERGWVSGKSNSPRAENFKRALDEHLRRTTSYYSRPCVPVDMNRPQDGMGPPDIRYDWTPASFRAVVDPRQPQAQRSGPRYEFFARQGYFEAKALADGMVAYTLTWKGYGASTGQACFQMASAERKTDVLSFAKKRSENGVDVYEVVARTPYQSFESWALTPEFKQVFADQGLQRYLEPQPMAYELARGDTGFEVISEQGRQITTRMQSAVRPEILTKLAGGVTAERVRAALETFLATPSGAQLSRVCLRLPESQQVDESTVDVYRPRMPGMAESPAPGLTFYNLLARTPYVGVEPLRGYVLMQKLEALGYATSEAGPAASFRSQPAAGMVRFTPTEKFLARYAQERCFPVGTVQVEAIARFEPLMETNLTPPFVARVKIKPYDEESAKIVAALPHFARMQQVGGVLRGSLQYQENELKVTSLNAQYPVYHPDVSNVRLPVIEAAPPSKGAPAPKPRAQTPPGKPGMYASPFGAPVTQPQLQPYPQSPPVPVMIAPQGAQRNQAAPMRAQ